MGYGMRQDQDLKVLPWQAAEKRGLKGEGQGKRADFAGDGGF